MNTPETPQTIITVVLSIVIGRSPISRFVANWSTVQGISQDIGEELVDAR
jgi:hypothetical protein